MSHNHPASERFILFTRDGCPYCDKAKAALKNATFKYEERKIREQKDRNEFYDDYGFTGHERTMPKMIIIADGKQIILKSSDEIVAFIDQYKRI